MFDHRVKQTTLCYLEQDDKYLMLHRVKKQNDQNHNLWIAVGGKVEEGESPDECMLREVREETGLQLREWQYRGIVTFVSDEYENEYMHLFTTSQFDGAMVEDCREGDLQWIAKSDLFNLPMWQGDRIFLRLLMNASQPFFSLKLVYTKAQGLVSATLDGRPLPLQ